MSVQLLDLHERQTITVQAPAAEDVFQPAAAPIGTVTARYPLTTQGMLAI